MADRDEPEGHAAIAADWARWSLTVRGRIPASWRRQLAIDPMLKQARVAIDVVLGRGHRVLASIDRFDLQSQDGEIRAYQPLLMSEPDLEQTVSIGTADPAARSVDFSVPGFVARVDDVLASLWPIAGQGEVSLICPGMVWEDRIVHVRGPLDGPIRFGDRDEIVDLGVVDPQIASREIPLWSLDATRFVDLGAVDEDEESANFGQLLLGSSVGLRVPLVVTGSYARPCPRVKASFGGAIARDHFLVGHGHLTVSEFWLDGVPSAQELLLDMGGTGQAEILHTHDLRSLPVTLIDIQGNAGASDLTVSVSATADRERLSIIPALRVLLRDYAGLGSDRLSARLLSEAEAKAGDGGGGDGTGRTSPLVYVNEPARALDYLSQNLLREFPFVSLAWDGPAIGPVVIDHRADPVFDMAEGVYPIFGRVASGRYEVNPSSGLRTSFSLRHSYDPVYDIYRGIAVRNPQNSNLCAMAYSIVDGDQPHEQIDAQAIYDTPTAEYTVDWLVEHLSRPYLSLTIEAAPIAWLMFRPGDTVRWSDPGVGLDLQKAIITRMSWSAGAVEIALRVYPSLFTAVGGGSFAAPSAG